MFKSNTKIGATYPTDGTTCPICKSYLEGELTCPLH